MPTGGYELGQLAAKVERCEKEIDGIRDRLNHMEQWETNIQQVAKNRSRLEEIEKWKAYVIGVSVGAAGLISATMSLIALWLSQ